MFAALIPLAAQFLGPIVNNVLQSVTSGLNQSNKQPSSNDSDKNFLGQQGNDLISGLASKALGSILGGFGAPQA